MRTVQIAAIAIAMLATIVVMRTAYGQAPPFNSGEYVCAETWPHIMVCRDKRTMRVVAECRKNNVTNRWECKAT